MNKAELNDYLETMIHVNANTILDPKVVYDGTALGELSIYFCLRRILNKTATLEDMGTLHAVNNLLQVLGLLTPNETLRSKVER